MHRANVFASLTALSTDSPTGPVVIPPPGETTPPADGSPASVTVFTSTTTATGKPTPSVVHTASAQDLVLDGSLLGLVAFCAMGLIVV